jgi:hypothetical protein
MEWQRLKLSAKIENVHAQKTYFSHQLLPLPHAQERTPVIDMQDSTVDGLSNAVL